jgi:hypothetical protein
MSKTKKIVPLRIKKIIKKKSVICKVDFPLEDMLFHCLYLSNRPVRKALRY